MNTHICMYWFVCIYLALYKTCLGRNGLSTGLKKMANRLSTWFGSWHAWGKTGILTFSRSSAKLRQTPLMTNEKGLFSDLNPGPLAPETRIMPLDRTKVHILDFTSEAYSLMICSKHVHPGPAHTHVVFSTSRKRAANWAMNPVNFHWGKEMRPKSRTTPPLATNLFFFNCMTPYGLAPETCALDHSAKLSIVCNIHRKHNCF